MLQEVQSAVGISGADIVLAAKYVAASHALDGMARQPEMRSALMSTMVLGQAITETTGIYSLLIAIVLLFVV